ncbi:NADP-dependent oxidoreductase [Temperatibacter marinus]|uniref:NADP-dependent oxidoreductase n=1 Tax=Temperatibacter marinus TaxID=1456591 RepID=A0AA52H8J6_9PROT|nr:NADP-dependent oxidoreductase [Temperatibacter marinus]WND02196.1 NADP-dependent oxidoreductase [Temperatibacter marinus]
MTKNKEILFKKPPVGPVTDDTFELAETAIPSAGDGQFVVQAHYMSVDPYMRSRMTNVKSYIPPFELGKPLQAGIVGEVVESNHDKFPVGCYVSGMGNWANYTVTDGEGYNQVPSGPAPLSYFLGILGMPGMTAWVGLTKIGACKEGDNVYVSAASGAVGQVVGQIAKQMGCHVSGSAGSDDKVAYLKELGFDQAFNYKTCGDLNKAIATANPKGIDVYFENVGGPMLEAVLNNMRFNGRIAACGMIADYDAASASDVSTSPRNLPIIIGREIKMQGFIVSNHTKECIEWIQQGSQWITEGKLKYRESVAEGLENAPQAFMDMMAGKNFGKQVVKLV